jgi:hypothetical protein
VAPGGYAGLYLGFAVRHVLAHDWIVLLELQLSAGGLWVLGRGVEVTSACAGDELDDCPHELSLRSQKGLLDAHLVDGAEATC